MRWHSIVCELISHKFVPERHTPCYLDLLPRSSNTVSVRLRLSLELWKVAVTFPYVISQGLKKNADIEHNLASCKSSNINVPLLQMYLRTHTYCAIQQKTAVKFQSQCVYNANFTWHGLAELELNSGETFSDVLTFFGAMRGKQITSMSLLSFSSGFIYSLFVTVRRWEEYTAEQVPHQGVTGILQVMSLRIKGQCSEGNGEQICWKVLLPPEDYWEISVVKKNVLLKTAPSFESVLWNGVCE